jgi:ArsR family transcriptional regulator, arsenate/arsenite/antimonite-responsive transcriptional repressor / arsenate reductase (thioredoxin)
MTEPPLSVLFLCTGNSARSQMAEALLRHLSKGRIEVFSAGSAPQSDVHPLAKATLQSKFGIDASDLHPKSMTRFAGQHFDYVIMGSNR